MKDLQIFDNPQFGKIRAVEIDGEPWLIGKDVAEALGYKNTNDALATHVDDDDKRIIQRSEIATFDSPIPKDVFPANFVCGDIPTRGLTAINESGLYSLILSSKLPGAKKFKKWVTAEVLPRIRKEGGYIAGVSSSEELLTKALLAAQRALEGQSARIAELEAENVGLMEGSTWSADAWTDEEFDWMLTYALTAGREDYITILYLVRYAGLSLDECFSIDMRTAEKAAKEKELTIRGEDGQERVIPLHQLVYQRIGWMVCRTQDRLFVLRSQTVQEAKAAFKAFFDCYSKMARRITNPRPLTFDGLRHTYAAEQYQGFITAGKTPYEARKAVSRLLGHGRDDVTKIYLAPLKGGAEDA